MKGGGGALTGLLSGIVPVAAKILEKLSVTLATGVLLGLSSTGISK